MQKPRFIFFGTPHLSVIVLEKLFDKGLVPSLIVTAPDRPQGRGLVVTETPVKKWALSHNIPTFEPEIFDETALERLKGEKSDVSVLVAYGMILPKEVLELSPHGILNVHPSLLPEFRGPSPVRSAILSDTRITGVSVMKLDTKMDHGPILVQEAYEPEVWPPDAEALDTYLFERGGELLAEVLSSYVNGAIALQEQNHEQATYCSLFKKEDGLLNLSDDAYTNLLKIHAYKGWPGTYFFMHHNEKRVRVKVLKAHLEDNKLVLDQVIPEGKQPVAYSELLKSYTLID